MKTSSATGCMTNPAVRGSLADSSRLERSRCTEGSVAEVSARPTDKKRTKSVSRAQSFWASVGDEAAVISQVAGNVHRQRPVDQDGDDETCAAELEASAAAGDQARCNHTWTTAKQNWAHAHTI